jgi:antirestriction protein ArdC
VRKRPADVKQGEYGCGIIYFSPIKGEKTDANGDKREYTFPLMRAYTVFNADQVEGGAEYAAKRFPKVEGNADQHDEAERIFAEYIKAEGIGYVEGGERACYVPSADRIEMPKREKFMLGTASYYGTKFHEAVHSTGHEKRLARCAKFAAFGSQNYAMEELVAEIGGCFLLGALNLPVLAELENHASYLQHWLGVLKSDHKAIFKASAAAAAAADLILKPSGILEAETETVEAVAV